LEEPHEFRFPPYRTIGCCIPCYKGVSKRCGSPGDVTTMMPARLSDVFFRVR
jgi:hypothetical protein